MRLIDAHKLYEQYEADMCELVKSTNCENISLEALSLLCGAKLIADAPTVDAVPVKHGRWEEPELEGAMLLEKRAYSQCSVCKKKSYLGRVDKYCRYCGAKMDLEEQDAQTEQSGK